MKIKTLYFLLMLHFFNIAQTQNIQNRDFTIEVYSSKFTFENTWWSFYKIDWEKNTIQYAQVKVNKDDEKPNFNAVKALFRDAVSPSKFIIINPNKIKVERISRKRSWLNFATPKEKNSPAERYYIKDNTLGRNKKGGEYLLDKELTIQFEQEKLKMNN